MKLPKEKCYACKHRRSVPGDAHSACGHPDLGVDTSDPFADAMAILAAVGRVGPQVSVKAVAKKFDIKADPGGVRRGWFNWPWNFDPVWLQNCIAFEEEEASNEKSS